MRERLAAQFLEAAWAATPAGGDIIIAAMAGSPTAAALATELALLLRLRSDASGAVRTAVAVVLRETELPRSEDGGLRSPAYQLLYTAIVVASPHDLPSWPAFAAALAAAGSFDAQLALIAARRSRGVSRALHDARMVLAITALDALFALGSARLPCAMESAHLALLGGARADGLPRHIERRGSFARVLGFGRRSAAARRVAQ